MVSFLMEHEHFSYPEAIRWLAKKYNIELEETEQTMSKRKRQVNVNLCISFPNSLRIFQG